MALKSYLLTAPVIAGVDVTGKVLVTPDIVASGHSLIFDASDAGAVYTTMDTSHLTSAQRLAVTSTLTFNGCCPTDLSGFTNATTLIITANPTEPTIPSLAALVAVTSFDIDSNHLTSIPSGMFAGLTAAQSINLAGNALTTVPSNLVTGLTVLNSLNFDTNALTTAAVNSVLVQLNALGTSNGQVDLSGGTNGSPSGAGLTAQTALEDRGWSVTVN